MKSTIEFEGIGISKDELHELLCKAIHEGDLESLDILHKKILDIKDLDK